MFIFTPGFSLAYFCTSGSRVESVHTVIGEFATCLASVNPALEPEPELELAVGVSLALAQPARTAAPPAMAIAARARRRLRRRAVGVRDDLIVMNLSLMQGEKGPLVRRPPGRRGAARPGSPARPAARCL